MSEGERGQLTELRDYVSDLRTNIEGHWNREGSREAHEQDGALRALQRVLLHIDGRIERDRKREPQPEGTSSG